jgi:nicotinamidase-related amidase
MPELSHIDPRSAALLVMDYQVDTLTKFMTAAQSADAIARVPDLIAMARDAGMMLTHVVVAFRPGHPEVSPRNRVFSAVKANGMLVAGSEGAAIHPAAAAREGEPVVVKHRISPFVGTDLETLLRAKGIDTLVLAGVHTSGVVLSTVRHAGDLDYRLVVVRDCCADPDAKVHAMLLDIVIAKQAAVVTTAELAGALPRRSSWTNPSDSVLQQRGPAADQVRLRRALRDLAEAERHDRCNDADASAGSAGGTGRLGRADRPFDPDARRRRDRRCGGARV